MDHLLHLVLELQQPEPTLETIRGRLPDRTVGQIFTLAKTEQIGTLVASHGEDRWHWKHNRLRDALVGRWLATHVGNGDQLDLREVEGTLHNPGLAEGWALALAFLPTADQRLGLLERLAECLPLALAKVVGLNALLGPKEHRTLVAALEQSVSEESATPTVQYIASPRDYLCFELSRVNDPVVEQATRRAVPSRLILEARIRNGDPKAILALLDDLAPRLGFVPLTEVESLESALGNFPRAYTGTPSELGTLLARTASGSAFASALLAAGYLAWPELGSAVAGAWAALDADRQLEVVTYAAWAFSRCDGPQGALEDAFDGVTRRGEGGVLPEDRFTMFADPLRAFRRWPVPRDSVATWIRVATECSALTEWLQFVLRAMDDARAVEAHVRWLASKGCGSWNPHWVPYEDSSAKQPGTRSRLWELVLTESDPAIQCVAYDCWRLHMVESDLGKLRLLTAQHPAYDQALSARVSLHDSTASAALIDRMYQDPARWSGRCGPLYKQPRVADAFLAVTEQALQNPLEWRYNARHLPPEAIRDLATRRRDMLLCVPDIWPLMWASAVPEAVELVGSAVATAEPKDLQYFVLHTDGPFPFPVTLDMLDALSPHLQRFSEADRKSFAELAIANGLEGWVDENLPEAAVSSYNRIRTKAGLIAALDDIAAAVPTGPQQVVHTLFSHGLIQRDFDVPESGTSLYKWLCTRPDHSAFVAAAVTLDALGSGRDRDWWLSLEPGDPAMHSVWADVLWLLNYRLWHSE
jgi:hypothetical protein